MEWQIKKKTAWDHVAGWLLAAIVGMAFWSLAIHLYDRFVGNEKGWSFYVQDNDMTCQVMKSKGKEHMACLPGDHRVNREGLQND